MDGNGRMHRHVPMAPDEYIGMIDPSGSLVHAGAALLLLVLPVLENDSAIREE